MTRKTLTILLFIFILSACGSNAETIPTSTSIPLQATSTFTPEPTPTNTPIPTATPFQYTSCLDPELIAEVVTDFEARNGMTLDEAYELTRKDPDFGKETTAFWGEPSYFISTNIFYIGNRLVSGENIPGGKVQNVLCAYGRLMAVNPGESYITVPLVLGWEDIQGNFHPFVWGHDRASTAVEGQAYGSEGLQPIHLDSLTAAQAFLNGLPDGAIIEVNIRTFARFSKIDDIVESSGNSGPKTNNLKDFLRMLGSQWAVRNFNQKYYGISSTLDYADPNAGDQGLFSSLFLYYDEGRLHPSE